MVALDKELGVQVGLGGTLKEGQSEADEML